MSMRMRYCCKKIHHSTAALVAVLCFDPEGGTLHTIRLLHYRRALCLTSAFSSKMLNSGLQNNDALVYTRSKHALTFWDRIAANDTTRTVNFGRLKRVRPKFSKHHIVSVYDVSAVARLRSLLSHLHVGQHLTTARLAVLCFIPKGGTG